MSTNQGPEYFASEKRYLASKTIEEKIFYLEEMMRNFKKHKGSENMLAELKTRMKKLKEKVEKDRKKGSGSKKGVKKEGYQCVLVGLTNSGKSSLLAALTNAKPKIEKTNFTTTHPEVGMMDYDGVKSQIIDLPSIGSEYFDIGIANTADCLLIVVEKLQDVEKIKSIITRAYGKNIIVINKSDLLSEEDYRKLNETIKSRKIEGVLVSADKKTNIEELKKKIISLMGVIRVFTKEPRKQPSIDPMILRFGSTVKDAVENIRKGMSNNVKEIRVTGPSSKFPNQKVGLTHELKDRDILEFHTK